MIRLSNLTQRYCHVGSWQHLTSYHERRKNVKMHIIFCLHWWWSKYQERSMKVGNNYWEMTHFKVGAKDKCKIDVLIWFFKRKYLCIISLGKIWNKNVILLNTKWGLYKIHWGLFFKIRRYSLPKNKSFLFLIGSLKVVFTNRISDRHKK